MRAHTAWSGMGVRCFDYAVGLAPALASAARLHLGGTLRDCSRLREQLVYVYLWAEAKYR